MSQISSQRRKILALVAEHEELSGGELLNLDAGLPRNSLYVILGAMEKRGWLISRVQKNPGERNRPRRYYKLTPIGRAALEFAQKTETEPTITPKTAGRTPDQHDVSVPARDLPWNAACRSTPELYDHIWPRKPEEDRNLEREAPSQTNHPQTAYRH